MTDESSHLYHLSILTPEKVIFENAIYSLIAPGSEGYFEVLAHHAALIILIKPGKLTLNDKNHQKTFYAVTDGFLEVSNNQASLLIDKIEILSNIDKDLI